jgi:hypothetical protein
MLIWDGFFKLLNKTCRFENGARLKTIEQNHPIKALEKGYLDVGQ